MGLKLTVFTTVPKNILNRPEFSQKSFLHFELLLTDNMIKTKYIMLMKLYIYFDVL